MEPIGVALKRARTGKGWSIGKVARFAEMDPGYLSKIETGKVENPGIEQVRRLLRALKVPCAVVFAEDEYLLEQAARPGSTASRGQSRFAGVAEASCRSIDRSGRPAR